MPVLMPTAAELRAMPAAEREQWLARIPVREVPVEVVREVAVAVEVPQVVRARATVGVLVDGGGYPQRRQHRLADGDVVRCPLCGAWTVGVCRTGHA